MQIYFYVCVSVYIFPRLISTIYINFWVATWCPMSNKGSEANHLYHTSLWPILAGMEIFSREAGWERSLHATVAWSNLTTSSFSEHAELNSTFRGGSYFWLVSQNSSINPTQAPDPFRMRDTALAQAEIGILGLVLALTTLGNSFVLWVLLRRRKYNAPMHLFMVNLCVADLVVAFFQVSWILYNAYHNIKGLPTHFQAVSHHHTKSK